MHEGDEKACLEEEALTVSVSQWIDLKQLKHASMLYIETLRNTGFAFQEPKKERIVKKPMWWIEERRCGPPHRLGKETRALVGGSKMRRERLRVTEGRGGEGEKV